MTTQLERAVSVSPIVEQLCTSPSVWFIRNFLSEEECNDLIELTRPRLAPCTVVDNDSGENVQAEIRTSFYACYRHGETEVVGRVEERISRLTHIPIENGEGLQVINYQVGQEYKPHYDFFDPAVPGYTKATANGGNRVLTVLMYLSNVEEGGETVLPEINMTITPEKGCALMFYNLYANGEGDFKTLHGSLPVIRGEKWISTKWIRERPYVW